MVVTRPGVAAMEANRPALRPATGTAAQSAAEAAVRRFRLHGGEATAGHPVSSPRRTESREQGPPAVGLHLGANRATGFLAQLLGQQGEGVSRGSPTDGGPVVAYGAAARLGQRTATPPDNFSLLPPLSSGHSFDLTV